MILVSSPVQSSEIWSSTGLSLDNCADHREIEADNFFMTKWLPLEAIMHLTDHFQLTRSAMS